MRTQTRLLFSNIELLYIENEFLLKASTVILHAVKLGKLLFEPCPNLRHPFLLKRLHRSKKAADIVYLLHEELEQTLAFTAPERHERRSRLPASLTESLFVGGIDHLQLGL